MVVLYDVLVREVVVIRGQACQLAMAGQILVFDRLGAYNHDSS